MSFYERLSYLDNSFLALESNVTHMHVAGLTIFETGGLVRQDGGVDIDRIRRFVESKLHLIPRYRQRLAYVPIERAPVWVDDEHFNIEYHVRHTSLPRPGNQDQLELLMGRLASQQLDRRKPLWELWVVEGLDDDRFAVVSKIHHAMIDGMASVELMAVLLDIRPVSQPEQPQPFEPREVPGGAELVVREAVRRTNRVVSAVRNVRGAVEDAQSLAMEGARRARAMGNSLASGWLSQATDTPLNGKVGPNRRFATLAMPLADVKEVKNSLGGTVNDVVLATVAGGVRRHLESGGFEIDDIDFRVMAPVSVRTRSQRSAMGNHVAMWLAKLPVAEPDPRARLAAVSQETMRLKTTDQAYGAAALVQLSAGTPSTLVSMASRLAAGARPFNMTVTNVPGPQFPMYMLDAKMVEQYPLVPLWHGHGVGIALFSYDGTLYWGFNGDYDIMEDLEAFATSIEVAFGELLDAARKGDAVPLRQKPKAKKRPPMGTGSSGAGAARQTPASTSTKPKARPPLGGDGKPERVPVNGFEPSSAALTIREFVARYRGLDDVEAVAKSDADAVAAFMRATYPRPSGVRGAWKLDADQQRAAAEHLAG